MKYNREMLQTLPLKPSFKSDYWVQEIVGHPNMASGTYNSVSILKKSIYSICNQHYRKKLRVSIWIANGGPE